MDLISGLPDDISRECLIRVTHEQFSAVAAVCKRWKDEIDLPEFRRLRKLNGHNQGVVAMVQARVDPTRNVCLLKRPAVPVYGITLWEPNAGRWSRLPPVPSLTHGLPTFCQVVAVGRELVVIGGCDPLTWKASHSVYVYNFISAKWRQGKDMPGQRRMLFACTSDSDRTVYVAGGHDDEKNGLRSAMAYDVAKDEWIELPSLERERDECKAVFHCGKLHVIGGYSTEAQGRFERSAEAFDVSTCRWDLVDEDCLEFATCPRTCVYGDDKAMYMCRSGDIVKRKNAQWKTVAKLPAEVDKAANVMTWKGQMLVIGSAGFGGPHVGYVLDLDNYKWTRLETPHTFSGHVQSGCFMEL